MNRILLIAFAVFVFAGIGTALGAIGWNNDIVAAEEGVKAQWLDNQNQYDSFWKKVQEVAQVPGKYKEDFKELLVAETQAKFGPEGSKAQMQWFQDRQINFSSEMYVKVQNVIEAGRNDFKRSQSELLDKQRRLRSEVRQFPGSWIAKFTGMPSILSGKIAPKEDLDGDGRLTALDFPIVTSAKIHAVFDSGEENETVNVFGK